MRSCDLRLKLAKEKYDQLMNSKVYSFSAVVPSNLPKEAGVYIIWLKDTEEVLYVGRTRNIQQRLYTNHLQGNETTARLKKYLVNDMERHPDITEYPQAKEFMQKHCNFQFILIDDNNERGHVEGLMGYLTDARYIEKEH